MVPYSSCIVARRCFVSGFTQVPFFRRVKDSLHAQRQSGWVERPSCSVNKRRKAVLLGFANRSFGAFDRLQPAGAGRGFFHTEESRIHNELDIHLSELCGHHVNLGVECLNELECILNILLSCKIHFVKDNLVAELDLLNEQPPDASVLFRGGFFVTRFVEAVLELVLKSIQGREMMGKVVRINDGDTAIQRCHVPQHLARVVGQRCRSRVKTEAFGDLLWLCNAGRLDSDIVTASKLLHAVNFSNAITSESAADATILHQNDFFLGLHKTARFNQCQINVDF
jgi:hypothetical protein